MADPLTPEERARRAEARAHGRVQAIEAEVAHYKRLKARLDRRLEDQAMQQQIERTLGTSTSRPVNVSGGPQLRGGSLGQLFIQSSAYKWWQERKNSLTEGWKTDAVELFPNDLDAATLTSDSGSPGSGGDLLVPDYQRGIIPGFLVTYRVADLIAGGTTDSNIVFMKETTFTNAANTVSEGGTKPESTLIFDQVSSDVRKIAHWLPVTDEMLEDVPQLRSYTDSRGRRGIQVREDERCRRSLYR